MKPNEIVICCIADQPSKISSNFMVSGGLNINMGKKTLVWSLRYDLTVQVRYKFRRKNKI